MVASVLMFLITLLELALLAKDFLICGLETFCLADINKEEELDLVDLTLVIVGTLLGP